MRLYDELQGILAAEVQRARAGASGRRTADHGTEREERT
jgi:hypothetical protein